MKVKSVLIVYLSLIFIISLINNAKASPGRHKRDDDKVSGSSSEDEGTSKKRLRTSTSEEESKLLDLDLKLKELNYETTSSDCEEGNKVNNQRNAIVNKIDIISAMIRIKLDKNYRKCEKEVINEIHNCLLNTSKLVTYSNRDPFLHYLRKVKTKRMKEYREKMLRAFSYIDKNFNETVSYFYEQFEKILDRINVLKIINKYKDDESSSSTSSISCISSNDPNFYYDSECADEEVSRINSRADCIHNVIERALEQHGPPKLLREAAFVFGTDELSQPGPSKLSKNIQTEPPTDESKTVNINSIGQNNTKNFYNKPNNLNLVSALPHLFQGRNLFGNDIRAREIKTFLTHMNEGIIPTMRPLKSKLAQAITAALIILQESGVVDELVKEYDLKEVRTKFIIDMMFERQNNGEIEKNDGTETIKLLNQVNEYAKYQELNKEYHTEVVQGNQELINTVMLFAMKTFPKVDLTPMNNQGSVSGMSVDEREFSDLEDVLVNRRIVVLVHSKEVERFINFNSSKVNCFYHRIVSMATEIIARNYFGNDKEKIRIEYQKTVDPIGALEAKKGHMTGLNMTMEETYPSTLLLGTQMGVMGVPLLCYNSYIVIDKRFNVTDLKEWYRFVKDPPGGKKVIITNFTDGSLLFSHAKDYKVIAVVLEPKPESTITNMVAYQPTAGLFWGIYPSDYKNSNYNIIDFPYTHTQGAYFRQS